MQHRRAATICGAAMRECPYRWSLPFNSAVSRGWGSMIPLQRSANLLVGQRRVLALQYRESATEALTISRLSFELPHIIGIAASM